MSRYKNHRKHIFWIRETLKFVNFLVTLGYRPYPSRYLVTTILTTFLLLILQFLGDSYIHTYNVSFSFPFFSENFSLYMKNSVLFILPSSAWCSCCPDSFGKAVSHFEVCQKWGFVMVQTTPTSKHSTVHLCCGGNTVINTVLSLITIASEEHSPNFWSHFGANHGIWG